MVESLKLYKKDLRIMLLLQWDELLLKMKSVRHSKPFTSIRREMIDPVCALTEEE